MTAEVLLCHALGQGREFLYGHSKDELTELAWIHYGRYLHQRLNGVPTQYITGKQEFYGREFRVSRAVLIPRPETEFVIEVSLPLIRPGQRILDAATGSGAIAITLALETGQPVLASDISNPAVEVARGNARSHGAPVQFLLCDLLSAFPPYSLDLVVSNPPYVALSDRDTLQAEVRDHEPSIALYAGPEGTEIYQRLIRQAETALRTGSYLVLELGYQSLAPVQAMMNPEIQPGWRIVSVTNDLAGIPRVLCAQWRS